MTEAECLQKLLHLDRLHLIALMPGNRIRLSQPPSRHYGAESA
jgi:hypothetical protein